MKWYPRNAGWHDRPDTHSLKRLHLPGKKRREGISPLCGRNAVICEDMPYNDPPEGLKCKNCKILITKLRAKISIQRAEQKNGKI